MIYLSAEAYSNGDPSKIYRGIDQNGKECGKGDDALYSLYPYLYFTNPFENISMRACVQSCPTYDSGSNSVSSISCAVPADCNSDTYHVTYKDDGTRTDGTTADPAAGDILGYDSKLVLDRVCVPNSNMFSTVFSSSSDSMKDALD